MADKTAFDYVNEIWSIANYVRDVIRPADYNKLILPNMSRALSRDKFGQTPCFSGPGLIIWPASLPRWTCLDRRASSQSNIRGFAGRAAAASDRRGSPPRALYVAGVASQFVATAGGVTFGLKSLPAGVPREQRPRE